MVQVVLLHNWSVDLLLHSQQILCVGNNAYVGTYDDLHVAYVKDEYVEQLFYSSGVEHNI